MASLSVKIRKFEGQWVFVSFYKAMSIFFILVYDCSLALGAAMNTSAQFIKGLSEHDETLVRTTPKADLHNHGILGGRLADLERLLGQTLPAAPKKVTLFKDFDHYIDHVLGVAFAFGDPPGKTGLEMLFTLAFEQAVRDHLTVLEMSIDSRFATFYPDKAAGFVRALKNIHQAVAPEISFLPELGIARDVALLDAYAQADDFLATDYFNSIDLYGDEFAQKASAYQDLYRQAKKAGIKLKAHVGEYGDAQSVRQTVELLELAAVQHGISSVNSKEVMNFLRDNHIQLNICPTSNVVLSRVPTLKQHPIRELFDHGIKVTVNTDDLMIFGQSVSQEFINLHDCGLFSAKELDVIRCNGLAS
jgi:adenosine deaminase